MRSSWPTGRSLMVGVALLAATVPVVVGGSASGGPRAAAPTPSPARPGKPTSVVAVGDSITQATGTGKLSIETPKNSWATGWEVNSIAARLGVPTNKRYNMSANGRRMTHFVAQIRDGKSGGSGGVAPMPADAGLVLVEMGGNDLCKDSVADMTTATTYREQFVAGLNQVKGQAPNALIQVLSVPDIYNLWYIRGAPKNATYHPEDESPRANDINGARNYWSIDAFPCQSLLNNASSYSQADRDRRAAVRLRNKEYNTVLAQECAKVLRCQFDNSALFNLTSNRKTPPDGALLPEAFWNFVDGDISFNEGVGVALCPVQGLVAGGCGDHFHPSKQGQGKVADTAWTYGRNYSDTTYPLANGSVLPSSRPGGVHTGRATVRFTGSDTAGLRGQEVRVHNPDGSVTAWSQHIGVAPDRVVNQIGTSWVEVRSLDINGNLSAGKLIQVDIDPALAPKAPGAPVVQATTSGLKVSWTAPADDGGATVTRYDLAGFLGAPPTPDGAPVVVPGGTTTTPPAPPVGSIVRYQVSATNVAGTSPTSPSSQPTLAPFATLAAFVDQQYRDFMGRAPTGVELLTEVSDLADGTETPIDFIDRLRSSQWFDGAYGPAIRLYRAYFLRQPDPSGLEFWVKRRREGRTMDKISQQFSVSSEFVRRYGSLTNTEFIDQIYTNVFNRPPDPSGRQFYLGRLAAGWSRGRVVLQFSESSEFKRQTLPITTVVELGRGMTGAIPSQVETEFRLNDFRNGGFDAVLLHYLGSTGYRSRVLA